MFGVSNLLLISSIGVASFIYFVFRLVQNRRFYNKLPGPPHSFLWGHLKVMGEASKAFPPSTHHSYFMTYLTQRYSLPEIFYLDLWPIAPSQMVVVSGEAAAQISTIRPYPIHQYVTELLTPVLGARSVATSNGPIWKQLHHILAPAFVPRYTKTLLGTMTDQTLIFHERLKVLAKQGTFSLEEEMSKPLFDIIGKIVFGSDQHAQANESPVLLDIKFTIEMFPFTFRTWNFIQKYWILSKQKVVGKRIDRYIADRAKERYAVLIEEKEQAKVTKPGSMLDRVLFQKIETSSEGSIEALDADYLQLIADNMKTLLIGGFMTTVDTLCYTFAILGTHPEVMKRLREEHDRIFGTDLATTADTIRNYPSKTNELEYTTAVLKEVLRFFPIGSATKENPAGSTALEYKSRSHPTAGQMIMISQQTIQLDPRNFPDPTTFSPDRFLISDEASKHRMTWRPFERGMRACLGADLAMDKMRVMLLLTARWFDFELVVEPNKTPRVGFTSLDLKIGDQAFQRQGMSAQPRNGMPMKVKPTGRT
ncbi:cytochrome P450 [Stipitochalara longipes BDJ]|nr:cytochrome P450 [Stipitochalara longipes BDJ]